MQYGVSTFHTEYVIIFKPIQGMQLLLDYLFYKKQYALALHLRVNQAVVLVRRP